MEAKSVHSSSQQWLQTEWLPFLKHPPAVQCRLPLPASLSWEAALALIGKVTGCPTVFPFSFALTVAIPASLQQISAVYWP